jgi:aerobic carbon-monoxide dehydrogenase large subunit
VLAIFTGADMAADGVGSLPCGWVVTDRHGEPHKAPPHFPLARDKARYVGDHVAVVIAETYAQARDAGRAGRGRLRGTAGRRQHRRARAGPRRSTTRRPAISATTGSSATRRSTEAFAKAAHVARRSTW